jgi:hypothetical protein
VAFSFLAVVGWEGGGWVSWIQLRRRRLCRWVIITPSRSRFLSFFSFFFLSACIVLFGTCGRFTFFLKKWRFAFSPERIHPFRPMEGAAAAQDLLRRTTLLP